MTTAADLLVRIDATTESLRRELKRAEQAVDKADSNIGRRLMNVERNFGRVNKAVGLLSAGIAAGFSAVAARELGRLGRAALSFADDLQTAADAMGVSTGALQTLQFAAEEVADFSPEKATKALEVFSLRIGEASRGTGEFLKIVEATGLRVRDAEGNVRPLSDLLSDYADIVARARTEQERLDLVSRGFGEQFRGAVNVFRDGAEGLRAFNVQGRELGRILEDEIVAAGAKASDELQRIERSARAAFQAGVVQGFADDMHDLDGALVEITATANAFGQALGEAMAWVAQNADVLQSRLEQIGRLTAAVVGAYQGLSLGGRLGPYGAAGGALAGGAAGFFAPELLGAAMGSSPMATAEIEAKIAEIQAELSGPRNLRAGVRRSLLDDLAELQRELAARQTTVDPASGALRVPIVGGTVAPAPAGGGRGGVGEAERELQRLAAAAETVRKRVRTPLEEYRETIADLDAMLARATLSQETYNRAATQALDVWMASEPAAAALIDSTERYREELDFLKDVGVQAFDRIGSAITDSLARGEDDFKGLQNVALGVISEITQALLRLSIVNPLLNTLFDAGAPTLSGLGGALGSLFNRPAPLATFNSVRSPGFSMSVPGFADGGAFTVGSQWPRVNAGRDNRMVSFYARDGETVTVQPPGAAGAGAVVINQSFDFRGADASIVPYLEQRLATVKSEAVAAVRDAGRNRRLRGVGLS